MSWPAIRPLGSLNDGACLIDGDIGIAEYKGMSRLLVERGTLMDVLRLVVACAFAFAVTVTSALAATVQPIGGRVLIN